MDVIKQLLGRLHPLFVHLPIGFIILGLLLQWYDRKKKEYPFVIGFIFLWGAITAVLACITGYLQYLGEGYAFDTVKFHLWSGIATAVFCFLMYLRIQKPKNIELFKRMPVAAFSIVLLVMISLTGHLGGDITHGEGYLTEPLPNSIKSALGIATFQEKEIVLNDENWQEAQLYADIIEPILNNKCASCHNPKKNKGELELHSQEGILKGGENGEIIETNNSEESPLYTRLVLPKDDEDHMPPKEKTQPTKEEITLVKTWIDLGNPFEGSIGELGIEKSLLLSFFPKKHDYDYPDVEVAVASQDSINNVKSKGIHVQNISKASNFLRVTCINKPSFGDNDFQLLKPLGQQIAVLDLGGTQVTDAIFEKLATLKNLTILKLDNTAITGVGIEKLSQLENLRSINLAATKFEENQLQKLAQFKKLQIVYLFNSSLRKSGIEYLQDGKITIDYGNYELPLIPSDSIIY